MKTNCKILFDLDGTITKEEVLPIIAKEVGLYEEIRTLTESTIRGIIPFHESFLKRVELLQAIPVKQVQDIVLSVPLNTKIVEFIHHNKDNCCIVTGNLDVWVHPLCEQIGVKSYTSQAEMTNGYIKKVTTVLEKGQIARNIKKSFNGCLIAVGEGNNDAEMMKEAEIGIAYGGVHAPARSVMAYASHAIYEEGQLCRFLRQLL